MKWQSPCAVIDSYNLHILTFQSVEDAIWLNNHFAYVPVLALGNNSPGFGKQGQAIYRVENATREQRRQSR